MAELLGQLGFVSAVLGGFAFTFVGALLTVSGDSRIYPWAFGTALFASLALMVAAVGSTLASLAAANAYPAELARVHELVSQAFLLGILALLLGAGLSGWLRSRVLGYVSSSIAALALLAAVATLLPFLGSA